MTRAYGIERLSVYPGSMCLDIGELCAARGFDTNVVGRTLMTEERSLIPAFEDTVTMAVNAAMSVVSDDIRDTIGLLIVSTESSVDQEKPVSSWAHRWLDLPAHCRNLEVKHACYGATGAMRLALAWLRDQEGEDTSRALIIGSDASLLGFGEPYEPVMGAVAFAMVLSAEPDFLIVDPRRWGAYAGEVSDVIRPRPDVETGNSETSLFAYDEALEGAWRDYERRAGEESDFAGDFARHIYHLPFAGMAAHAHRTLAGLALGLRRREADADYRAKVEPSLSYSRRIGSSYSASTFLALLSLVDHDPGFAPGDSVSVYAYGSGSCAEFYAARLGARARDVAKGSDLANLLDGRRRVSVEEYEASETARVGAIGAEDFEPDRDLVPGLYDHAYRGTGRLVLDRIAGFNRHYVRA